MAELKPCPFCGYVFPEFIEARTENDKPTYSVRCGRCGTGIFRAKINRKGEVWDSFRSTDEAVKAWNRRTDMCIFEERDDETEGYNIILGD